MMIETKNSQKYTGLEIAVIGISCRFPGANNWRAFWNNLVNATESIDFLSDQELADLGVDDQTINDKNFVKAKISVKDKELFDSSFFDYRPGEARLMHPAHRIFHECIWEALEDSGYDPEQTNDLIGIYAGSGMDLNWPIYTMLKNNNKEIDDFTLNILNNKDYLSSLISYKLNLKGPAFSVNTACSTSLVAVNLACKSLLLGETKIALAGGISISSMKQKGFLRQDGMIHSSDGHCRTFDKSADGTVAGEGAGVVVLKRLADAIKDNDQIYSIIKGTSINNDGNRKVGFTAPSIEGQVECIRRALKIAKVNPESISYVEAHGTGTKLGDPIEIEALNSAFNNNNQFKCAIGSVKSNIGHLDTAAGVAGLIKTILSLKYRKIPASLHFKEPNPNINFGNGPFYVNSELSDWKSETGEPLRAGVSSFGLGGTNAHVILEEAPLQIENDNDSSNDYKLLNVSAKTENSLQRYITDLKLFLQNEPKLNLNDVSYTLQTGRKHFLYRKTFVYKTQDELINLLDTGKFKEQIVKSKEINNIVFMFPGAGSQYINMGKDLYEREEVFREEMDKGFLLLKKLTGVDYKEIFYPRHSEDLRINDMLYTQAVIFIFEYSLAQLLMFYGIKPQYMIGHSVGEYVAACISNVFEYEDALKLVLKRGELMFGMPKGAMLSVQMKEDQINEYLNDTLSLAAVNGFDQVVFSGSIDSINELINKLEAKGISWVKLYASNAAHSYMIDDILEEYENEFKTISLSSPQIPFISCLSGVIAKEECKSSNYWLRHMREPVRFSDGIKYLLSQDNDLIFIEVGGSNSLTSLLKQVKIAKVKGNPTSINFVRHPKELENDVKYFMNSIGQIWSKGAIIDWNKLYKSEKRKRISLPTYSFEPIKYPIEVDPLEHGLMIDSDNTGVSRDKNKSLKDWLYYPIWKQSILQSELTVCNKTYLYFSLDNSFCNSVKMELLEDKSNLIEVIMGKEYKSVSANQYVIDPHNFQHYKELLAELKKSGVVISDIVYSWGMHTGSSDLQLSIENKEINLVFFNFVRIIQAFIQNENIDNKRIAVLTNSLHKVIGNETIYYNQSLLLGLINVLPQEYSTFCCNIDVELENDPNIKKVVFEIKNNDGKSDRLVAIRNNQRWIQDYQKNSSPVTADKNILKKGGVYFITGGLGNVGFILTKYILQNYDDVKIIIIGRKKLPLTDQQVLVTEGNEWLTKLNQLKDISNKVSYFSVDITDAGALKKIISEVEKTIGEINGFIHTAADLNKNNFELLQDITFQKTLEMFSPKLKGIENIYEVFQNKKLDFVWITSSLASVLAGLSYGPYSSANNYMDYFIASKGDELTNWKCIGLSEMLFEEHELKNEKDSNRQALKPAEIEKVFQWSLSVKVPLILQTVRDLSVRINNTYINKEIKSLAPEINPESNEKSERPNLNNQFVPPETETEKTLVLMLEDFFGVVNIGIEDDFFELGGNSLNGLQFVNKIRKQLKVKIKLNNIFEYRTFKQLAKFIDDLKIVSDQPNEQKEQAGIQKISNVNIHPLSSGQRRMWIMSQTEQGSLAYSMNSFYNIQGNPDAIILNQAVLELINRHEILRTIFVVDEGEPKQKVLPISMVDFKLEQFDVTNQSDTLKMAKEILYREAKKPFDLSKGPLLRIILVKLKESEFQMLLSMHHIISDGWSMAIFFEELLKNYSAIKNKNFVSLPSPNLQYKDYSSWQNDLIKNGQLEPSKQYWAQKLGGEVPILPIPTDFVRPPVKTFEGAEIKFELDEELIEALKKMSLKTNSTVYILMLSAFKSLLYYYAKQEDVIVGSDFSGRVNSDTEGMIGMFINVMALRSNPSSLKTFSEYLGEVKRVFLDAVHHQEYQFDDIVADLITERDMSRNPFFDVMFLFQNFDQVKIDPDLIDFKIVGMQSEEGLKSPFDISIIINDQNLHFDLKYNISLFKKDTIELFGEQFKYLLKLIVEDEHILLSEIMNQISSFTDKTKKTKQSTIRNKNLISLKKIKTQM